MSKNLGKKNLNDWLEWQSTIYPKGIELGLNRIRKVWGELGKPSPAKKIISIAGTNGKGSCTAILESILNEASYNIGTYTSPHLQYYNERIKINRRNCESDDICLAFSEIEEARGSIPLSFFEFGTLAAILIFSKANLDIAILEIGLGGRLDAVNIIDADISLITTIGLDHTDWLGNSTEQIGEEKAGIMRANKPVIFASPEMPSSIEKRANFIGARLSRVDSDYFFSENQLDWDWYSEGQSFKNLPKPSLKGAFQIQNAAACLKAMSFLPEIYRVNKQQIESGLKNLILKGRFDIYQRNCRWVLDVAHNFEATKELVNQLKKEDIKGDVYAVIGIYKDKPIREMLLYASSVITQWNLLDLGNLGRGASEKELLARMPDIESNKINTWKDIDLCLTQVENSAQNNDIVLVFGSFVTVGKTMDWMNNSLVE